MVIAKKSLGQQQSKQTIAQKMRSSSAPMSALCFSLFLLLGAIPNLITVAREVSLTTSHASYSTDINPAIVVRSSSSSNNASLSLSLWESFYTPLHEEWCDHLQTHSEPRVVVYPRMPKCGSSTMNALFKYLSEKNNFEFVATPRETWTSLDLNRKARQETIALMKSSKRLLVAGHFEETIFTDDEIRKTNDGKGKTAKNLEMIQLIRDCEHKATSLFYYTLFQQRNALEAERKGKLNEFIAKELGFRTRSELKSFNVTHCLEDESCIRRFGFIDEDHYRDGIRFLCGAKCLEFAANDVIRGTLYNAFHPQHFAILGVLSNIEEYLDMLECAYPKMLKGISRRYRDTNLHQNPLSAVHSTSSVIVEKVINDTCNPERSDYSSVYRSVESFLHSRYQFMTANRARCCRRN